MQGVDERECPCGQPDPSGLDLMDGHAACPLVNGPPELAQCPYLSGYVNGRADLKHQMGG